MDLSIYLITCAHASATSRLTNLFSFISFIFIRSFFHKKRMGAFIAKYLVRSYHNQTVRNQNELKRKGKSGGKLEIQRKTGRNSCAIENDYLHR